MENKAISLEFWRRIYHVYNCFSFSFLEMEAGCLKIPTFCDLKIYFTSFRHEGDDRIKVRIG